MYLEDYARKIEITKDFYINNDIHLKKGLILNKIDNDWICLASNKVVVLGVSLNKDFTLLSFEIEELFKRGSYICI